MIDLKGKNAFITGASGGIGKAISIELARLGANIGIHYNSNKEKAESLQKEIIDIGVKAEIFQADISDFNKAKEMMTEAWEKFEPLHILINNAGISRSKTLMMMAEEEWNSVINTNLNGLFNVTRAGIVNFLKQRYGRIINISSVAGFFGLPGATHYCASKAGIIGFTKSLAKETSAYGVTVNAIAPGFINTEMINSAGEKFLNKIIENIPMQRIGEPDEVSGLTAFLASDRSSYITGQVFVIDGGMSS